MCYVRRDPQRTLLKCDQTHCLEFSRALHSACRAYSKSHAVQIKGAANEVLMLVLLSLALFLLAVCVVFLMPSLLGVQRYRDYDGTRVVTCPESRRLVAVSLDAARAAGTSLVGSSSLRIAGCTRWPEREGCGQECIPQALRAEAYTEREVAATKGPIFHLPVLLAASAAWVIGAFWHSQYLFRGEWREALGLSRMQLHELGWQLAPHVLTFAAPLLFAYAVAMILASIGKSGPIVGVVVSVGMWAVFVLAIFALTELTSLSRELLRLEFGYTLIAVIVMGLIVGGFTGKMHKRQEVVSGTVRME